MDIRTKLQMERAARVIGFSREHPSDLPGYQAAVSGLEQRLVRTRRMAEQAVGSRLEGHGAVADRARLARLIVADLQLLAGIARAAGVESAGTPKRISYPGPRRSQVQFLGGARVAVAETEREVERLTAYGLPPDHLVTLTRRLDEFQALLERRDEKLRARIGARSEMLALAREMGGVIQQLDTLNRHRFLGDPGTLAVWRSTRKLRPIKASAGANGGQAPIDGGSEPILLPPGQPTQ